MSGLDLVAIRLALAERLETIDGLFVYREWPGTPQIFPSMLIPPPDRVGYSRTSNRGLDMATWDLLALVGRPGPTSVSFLEELMSGTGPRSVVETLYADRRLGGVVSNLRFGTPEAITSGMYAVTRTPNDDVLGATFQLEIAA